MYHYYCNCVSWPPNDVHGMFGLCKMIELNLEISRKTFLKKVDREELRILENELGYFDHPAKGLTMAGDYTVSYHRSTLHNQTVYYFRHSAIEYVFVKHFV